MCSQHGLLPKNTSCEKCACACWTREGFRKLRKERGENWNANLIVKDFRKSAPILAERKEKMHLHRNEEKIEGIIYSSIYTELKKLIAKDTMAEQDERLKVQARQI